MTAVFDDEDRVTTEYTEHTEKNFLLFAPWRLCVYPDDFVTFVFFCKMTGWVFEQKVTKVGEEGGTTKYTKIGAKTVCSLLTPFPPVRVLVLLLTGGSGGNGEEKFNHGIHGTHRKEVPSLRAFASLRVF